MVFSLPLFAVLLGAMPAMAAAEVPRVLTDLPVVQSLVAQVMGDLGAVEVLLQQGSDVHSLQLRPSQMRALAEADLVFWVGQDLTPWLGTTLASLGLSDRSVALLSAPGVKTRAYGAPYRLSDPSPGPEAAAGDDLAGSDPHAWLDPANAQAWLEAIAAELSARDRANGATYRANAATAKAAIDRLDARIKAILAPVAAAPIVVHHQAYGYFSAYYGVNIVGWLELGDAAAPSAERLAELRATLLAQRAVCLFPEAQHDPKLVLSVVEGSGVRIGAALDPEGSSLAYGPLLYGDLMIGLASAIADCVASAN